MPADNAPAPVAPGSWASSPAARATMVANRGRDTSLELAVRSRVHAAGLRYNVNRRPIKALRRTADLLFPRRRIAAFLDGCFWHRCPQHYQPPRTNPDFWHQKITRNVQRDRETDHLLTEAGWTVLRYWEHQPPDQIADAIIMRVRAKA